MEPMPTCNDVKDYLMSRVERLPNGASVSPGTQQNIWWMNQGSAPVNNFDEVYPSILLGDYAIAKDTEKLKSLGVTHVVNCACGTRFNMVNTDQLYFDTSGIKFHGIPAVDTWKFKITPYFSAAADFLKDALDSGGKVYVHCMSGVSRSSTIVLAFMLIKRNMQLLEAVKTVRDKRKILPNDGFLKELIELNDTIYASKINIIS